ncbi:MAG: glycoside hydrolase family 2 TIM barrel-domain containing protein [Oscillospiraceae bacterium]
MKSVWSDKIDKNSPLNEYPRPQLQRDNWQCLNGYFDYCIKDKNIKQIDDYDGKILVPFALESFLSEVKKPLKPSERLWYRKTFTVSDSLKNQNIILHFGGVDWQCKIFINKKLVGTHTGGYSAFSFNITDFLNDGENELTVCVYDPTDFGWQQRGKQVNEPHGFWYTATSGIWQTVWLESVNNCYIKKIKMLPNIDNKTVNIKTELSETENTKLRLSIFDNEELLLEKEISNNEDILMPKFICWCPENPKLYDIKLEVYKDDILCDNIKSYFGMRKFAVQNDKYGVARLFLNNEPYFQKGLLDQGYWCDGGMTSPTDEAMIFDISEMKRLGFNMLRKHIKIEPLRWYYHCDRLGMIVWQDMISGGKYIGDFYAGVLPNIGIKVKDNKYTTFSRGEKKWRDDYRKEISEMIDLLYNSVSIYCWVPFNEAWGQFDALKVCKFVKNIDNSRVVDHASGWYDQGGGDIKSIHKYILPIRMPKLDKRAFVLTEFGGYSRIVSDHTWNEKKAFGYVMFKTKETLGTAYEKLFKKQVIPLIDRGLSGTIYTQLSDVENEVNGIYTYDRTHLKIDEDILKKINSELKY